MPGAISRLSADGVYRGLGEFLLLVCLVATVAQPALNAGFHSDDFEYLDRRYEPAKVFLANKEGLQHVGGRYRPIALTSILADRGLHGLEATGYNVTNKFLHLVCAVELLVLVRLLFPGHRGRACLTAALFAVQPVSTDTIFWISARPDSLCTAFYLFSLLTFTIAERRRAGWAGHPGSSAGRRRAPTAGLRALSIAGSALALMSKEMAVTMPGAIVLVHLACQPVAGAPPWPSRVRRALTAAVPYAAVLALYLLLRLACLGSVAGGIERMDLSPLHLLGGFGRALSLMTFPASRYDLVLVAALALGLALPAPRRHLLRRETAFGLAWVLLTLTPVLGVVNRWYMYLPTVGMCLCLATVLTPRTSSVLVRRSLATLAVAVLVFHVFVLRREARLWESSGRVAATILEDLHRHCGEEGRVFAAMVPAGIVDDGPLGLGEKPVFAFNLQKALNLTYRSRARVRPVASVFLRNQELGAGTAVRLDDRHVRIVLDEARGRFSGHTERVPPSTAGKPPRIAVGDGYTMTLVEASVATVEFDEPTGPGEVVAFTAGHMHLLTAAPPGGPR